MKDFDFSKVKGCQVEIGCCFCSSDDAGSMMYFIWILDDSFG
jgi:hypothetical protein